jgi:hypothetical protein
MGTAKRRLRRLADMLLTLRHLLLTVVLVTAGIAFPVLLAGVAGLPEVSVFWAFGGVGVALFGLGWPLYRLMHLRPIGLPRCPHCRKLHANYHAPADAWPSGVLVCVSCGKPTRFYMSRKKPLDNKSDMPGLYLYWPEFIGLWRPVEDPIKKV